MENSKEMILILKKIQQRFHYLKGSRTYDKENQNNVVSYKINNQTIYFDLSKIEKGDLKDLNDLIKTNIIFELSGSLKNKIQSWTMTQLYGSKNPYVKAKKLNQKFTPLKNIFTNIRKEYNKIISYLIAKKEKSQEQFQEKIIEIKEQFIVAVKTQDQNNLIFDKIDFIKSHPNDYSEWINNLDEQWETAKEKINDVKNEVNNKRKR